MDTKTTSECIVCGISFRRYERKGYPRRYCSVRCYNLVRVKNLGNRMKGRHHSPETVAKIKELWAHKVHPGWKGVAASYQTIHQWVRRHKGTPQSCEHCGYNGPDRQYEWANVSGEYYRDLNDYKRVCQQCHRRHYDNAKRKVAHGHFVGDNISPRKAA